MGSATFIVGVLPTSDQIGFLAPTILIALRLLQRLALGGEYGGAATYVAEHPRTAVVPAMTDDAATASIKGQAT